MDNFITRRTSPQMIGTSLIGRATECDAVERLLLVEHARLVAITGPGGVGKTRLALHVTERIAPRFRDGSATVFLASVTDYRLVPLAIARSLDLKLTGDAPPDEEIARALVNRELLLMIDTFEHLLPAAHMLSGLLEVCPGLSMVVTSRATLGIPHEAGLRLAPLATPPETARNLGPEAAREYDAVALFEDRARAVSSEFILTSDNAEAIASICRRLDGLPLAIELAAARTRALPPKLMLRHIEARHEAPGEGARDAQARHRTMRNAISWSYDLLSPADQQLFRALSVFRGSFTIGDAVALIGQGEERVPESVDRLVSASLLMPVSAELGAPEYVMLGLLREYGRDRLSESGEERAIRDSHAQWVAARIGGDSRHVNSQLEEIRAAVDWALAQSDRAPAEALLSTVRPLWIERGFYQELRGWLERATCIEPRTPPPPSMLVALSQITARQGEMAQSLAYAEAAFDRAFRTDDRSMLADAALAIAIAEGRMGNHDRSQAMSNLALGSLREIADPARIADAQAKLAHLAMLRGDLTAAQSCAEEALEYRRTVDDPGRAIDMLDLLSLVARMQGDTVRQSALARQTLELVCLVDDPFVISSGLWTAAAIACERGCYQESARFYGAEEAVRQASGFAIDPGYSEERTASVAMVKGALGARLFSEQWEMGYSLAQRALADAAAFLTELADREQEAYQAEKRALRSLGLSDRQQDVLRLIGQGRSDREIADLLSISARTVSKHVEAILIRMDARTRSGAAAIAARLSADARSTSPGILQPGVEPGHRL